mgnify:CR=1 FL=1
MESWNFEIVKLKRDFLKRFHNLRYAQFLCVWFILPRIYFVGDFTFIKLHVTSEEHDITIQQYEARLHQ